MPETSQPTDRSPEAPRVDADGRIVLPAVLTERLDICAGEELACEPMSDGVCVVVDRLRKVYVEATNVCDLDSQARIVRRHRVGHVDERTLADIWRDEACREFRRRVRAFDFPPCFHCGGCSLAESNEEDCHLNPFPVCGECLWAQGIVICP